MKVFENEIFRIKKDKVKVVRANSCNNCYFFNTRECLHMPNLSCSNTFSNWYIFALQKDL